MSTEKSLPLSRISTTQLVVYSLILLLFIIGSVIFNLSLQNTLHQPYNLVFNFMNSISDLITLALGYLIILAFFAVSVLLIQPAWIRYLFYLITGSGILLLNLPFSISAILIIGLLLTFIFLDYRSWKDLHNHLRPDLLHIFGRKMHLLSTALSFLIAIALFIASNDQLESFNFTLPNNLIEQAITLSAPLLTDQINLQQDALLQDAITQINEQLPFLAQLPDDDKTALLQGTITPTVQEALLAQGFSPEQIDLLAEQLSVNLSQIKPNEENVTNHPLIQEAQIQVQQFLENIVNENKGWIPWLVSGSIFLLLNSLGFIFNFLAILISYGLLKILTALKLVEKHTYTVSAERYRLTDPSSPPQPTNH